MSEFYLGLPGSEQPIKTPKTFTIEEVEIAREGRLSSGRLVKDIIAVKKRFVLCYEGMTSQDAEVFKTEYDRKQFLSFKYPDRGVTRTATVWFAQLPRELLSKFLTYWANVTIVLEEQ